MAPRTLLGSPIDPQLNVVVLLKPFGHVKTRRSANTKIMADKDFEEFSDNLDELPQHFKASDKTYQ